MSPRKIWLEEFKRCNEISFFDWTERFINIDFSKYKNIIVWGDNDLHHLLFFALISKTVIAPKIYYINNFYDAVWEYAILELIRDDELEVLEVVEYEKKEWIDPLNIPPYHSKWF